MKNCVPVGLGKYWPKPAASAMDIDAFVIVTARIALASFVNCLLPTIYSLRKRVFDHEIYGEDFFQRLRLDVGLASELDGVLDTILPAGDREAELQLGNRVDDDARDDERRNERIRSSLEDALGRNASNDHRLEELPSRDELREVDAALFAVGRLLLIAVDDQVRCSFLEGLAPRHIGKFYQIELAAEVGPENQLVVKDVWRAASAQGEVETDRIARESQHTGERSLVNDRTGERHVGDKARRADREARGDERRRRSGEREASKIGDGVQARREGEVDRVSGRGRRAASGVLADGSADGGYIRRIADCSEDQACGDDGGRGSGQVVPEDIGDSHSADTSAESSHCGCVVRGVERDALVDPELVYRDGVVRKGEGRIRIAIQLAVDSKSTGPGRYAVGDGADDLSHSVRVQR